MGAGAKNDQFSTFLFFILIQSNESVGYEKRVTVTPLTELVVIRPNTLFDNNDIVVFSYFVHLLHPNSDMIFMNLDTTALTTEFWLPK